MKTRIVQNEPNDRAAADQAVTQGGSAVDHAGSAPPPELNRFRAFVRRYELVIFFALTYLIAWSTIPFGSFLAFSPLVSALVVVFIAEGLPGLARLGRRLIRWRVSWIWYAAAIAAAAAGVRRGDRSEHGCGRPRTLTRSVPAVVRGDLGLFGSWDSQSPGWAPRRGARPGAALPSLGCNRSGHPWCRRPCSGC